MSQDQEYLYAQTTFEEERARLQALEAENDPRTIRVLEQVGVTSGWRCLEIGAGAGSIASWLCDRVGADGRVFATDLDPRFLELLEHPNLEVRRHDILNDPLEPASYDLVHSRFLLEHLPEDDRALDAMIAALKPGGVLVAEDVDFLDVLHGEHILRPAGAVEDLAALWQVIAQMGRSRGIRLDHGRRLPIQLQAHGLVDVDAIGERRFSFPGSSGAEVARRSVQALKERTMQSGFGDPELFDRALRWLDDPELLQLSPLTVAAWGRKPG